MIITKNIFYIIGLIISIFCVLLGLLLFIIGMVEVIPSLAVCGIVIVVISILGLIFIGRQISEPMRSKSRSKIKVVAENTTIADNSPLYLQISPEEKLQRLVVKEPHISLNEGEVCYYCDTASAIHQKCVVTGRTSGGAGVSLRVAKGVSIRTGGGNSQVIRENKNEYFEGTLYITNIRIILLAPKYGFDLYISKITQLLFKDFGLEIFSHSKCYQVLTADSDYIKELVEFMNSQSVFKDEKWLKEQQKHINSTSSTALSIKQELSDLKWLLDEGIITQEEFDAKKKQLLGL